jgi:hypothetical protein
MIDRGKSCKKLSPDRRGLKCSIAGTLPIGLPQTQQLHSTLTPLSVLVKKSERSHLNAGTSPLPGADIPTR